MASPSTADITFEEFLRQLAGQRGKARKLRFAASYWRKLERLPDSERQRVALALGSEAAWKQLERARAGRRPVSGVAASPGATRPPRKGRADCSRVAAPSAAACRAPGPAGTV